jgi:hypothetical protein
MKTTFVAALLICQMALTGCRQPPAGDQREALRWSAWIEETAIHRGHIEPGDFAQFGCPPGWRGVDDTAAALQRPRASAQYRGTDPPPREGSITCVAQKAFALPAPYASQDPERDPTRRPLAPVWVTIDADRTTIGFRRELPPSAAIYIGQETPCGPRLIGVRLGDLLKWLADPGSGTKRDFLGMVSAGCPDTAGP